MFKIVLKATQMAQKFIGDVVREEDVVVDATLGNGKDTIFLSSLVQKGKVYSFDIQKGAIDSFKKYMIEMDIKNIELIHSGHENIEEYVKERPAAVMFNLGYLPGGDESIMTLPYTTIMAVDKGLKLLKPGGIMTIVSYSGHIGGLEEQKGVLKLVRELNPKAFSLMEIRYTNGKTNSPMLIVIEKNNSFHEDI